MGKKILHENLEERDPFEDIGLYKVHHSGVGCVAVNYFHLDEDRDQIRDIVSTVINSRVK
jgi:hypothetical protein